MTTMTLETRLPLNPLTRSAPSPGGAMARLAGVLYLSLALLAPFSILYVPSKLLVPGDAGATVAQILAQQGLFRAGMTVDAIIFLIEVVLTVLLYKLLEPVSQTLSLMAAFSRLANAVIQAVNLGLFLAVLRLASSGAQHELVLALFNAHGDLVLVWQAFFGLHCGFLGCLVYRSGYFPKLIGAFLMLASAGYLFDSLGRFLTPAYGEHFGWVVGPAAVLGELSFTLWLLIKGVRRPAAATGATA